MGSGLLPGGTSPVDREGEGGGSNLSGDEEPGGGPVTRNQQDLIRGLNRIRPVGMTPLADGIITAVDLILSSRPHNPTLVLITDGLPNYPLWSFDAEKDALEAAAVPKNKIRLICIGVEANRGFLERLADVGQGKLFVVDDLNSANLINIVKHEKRLMNLAEKLLPVPIDRVPSAGNYRC